MKIIHFTDTHFIPEGETLYGRDPAVALEQCIKEEELRKDIYPFFLSKDALGISSLRPDCGSGLHCFRTRGSIGYSFAALRGQSLQVPLGQTDGQCLQLALSNKIPGEIEKSLNLKDEDLGASAVSMAIASSLHETQYTRLFRS